LDPTSWRSDNVELTVKALGILIIGVLYGTPSRLAGFWFLVPAGHRREAGRGIIDRFKLSRARERPPGQVSVAHQTRRL